MAGKPTIALCALTGVGNAVLAALCNAGHTPRFVVTRRESGPYPYYPETDLAAEAERGGIPCLFEAEGEARIVTERPDLVLVATYHRILGEAIRQAPRRIVNLHPSLLPRHRGPNPIFWVLHSGERQTGLTAHELTGAVDAGEIYWQRSLDIMPAETQGTLRRRLAALAADAACEVVAAFAAGRLAGAAQDEQLVSLDRRPTDADRTLHPGLSVEEAMRIARACTPYPGALVEGRAVRDVVPAAEGNLRLRDGAISFTPA